MTLRLYPRKGQPQPTPTPTPHLGSTPCRRVLGLRSEKCHFPCYGGFLGPLFCQWRKYFTWGVLPPITSYHLVVTQNVLSGCPVLINSWFQSCLTLSCSSSRTETKKNLKKMCRGGDLTLKWPWDDLDVTLRLYPRKAQPQPTPTPTPHLGSTPCRRDVRLHSKM